MKKMIFIILCCILAACRPVPKLEILGRGSVQSDAGILYVEINSQKYTPHSICYIRDFSKPFEQSVGPIEGMHVTCFKRDGKINFVAGQVTQEELEQHYAELILDQNALIFLLVLFGTASLIFYLYILVIAHKNRKSLKNPEEL